MNNPVTQSREILRSLLILGLGSLLFALSIRLFAQPGVPAPLPPAAQEAFDKGIMAARSIPMHESQGLVRNVL